MKVQQISVFLENKSGRLADVAQSLAAGGVNVRALTLADTTDFGILRLIVNDTPAAVALLKGQGFTVGTTDVVAIEVPDRPGGLAEILATIGTAGINVEYMYAFVERQSPNAVVIFRFDETERAITTLQGAGVTILPGEKIYLL
jgi:hypothetical protein